MQKFSTQDSQMIWGKGEIAYQRVIDDFKNANFIRIMTYNISTKSDSYLLKALKDACAKGTDAVIITNIPKRFPSYFKPNYAIAAKNMIDLYKKQLKPQDYMMRLSTYFSFCNHAKVIMTDNIVYWGSCNFSDESSRNFECGTISGDKELIKYFKDSVFPDIQGKSVPYFKYNFVLAIANLERLIPACKEARQNLFDAAFEPWADYETNFEERWVYRTTDNDLTVSFLRGFINFISQFEDALNVIDNIIDEYWEYDKLPEEVETLKTLFEEYKITYDKFYDSIEALFQSLEEVARYDVSEEACRKIINDYGMVAYDEELDYYAEKAFNEASGEYEALIIDSERTIRDALCSLDCIIEYFEHLKTNLYKLLKVNSKIDNTGVN